MKHKMCRFIYTGRIDITKHLARDLLVAADQYLIEGLKRLCEYTIAQVCIRKNLGGLILLQVRATTKWSLPNVGAGHLCG